MVARRVRPLTASFLFVFVGACNLLNGTGDLNVGEGPGNGVLPDGGRIGDGASGGGEGGGGGDGGGTTGDGGGFISDAGINPKVSSCGLNQVCLPNAGGWIPANFLLGGGNPNGGCPTNYPQPNTLKMSGGGNCNCTCSPSGGACAGSVDSESGAACGGAATNLAALSGQCTDLTATLPLPVAFTAHPSGPMPKNCGGTVAPQLNGPRPATYCTGAVPAGGTCSDPGEICVKQAPFPFGGLTCIVHDGDIACPSHLNQRTVLATTITDGRSCSNSCSCQPEPCGGTLEAFSGVGCATSVRKVNVDGTCTTAGMPMSGASYRYTPSLGCGVSVPATVLGSETFTAPRTLCCSFGF